MNARGLFDRDGYVKLAPKVGDGKPLKPVNKEKQYDIDFCLNCKKPRCRYGNCKERPHKRSENDE